MTALLRYNSHTMYFAHLKCSMQHFLVYLQSCITITAVNFRTMSSPQRETLYPLSSYSTFLPLSPQLLLTTNLLSVSMGLPTLDISHKWNHIICGCLCLASSSESDGFRAHPWYSMCQYLTYFEEYIIFNCMDIVIWYFIYSCISWYFSFSSLAVMHSVSINISCTLFSNTPFF